MNTTIRRFPEPVFKPKTQKEKRELYEMIRECTNIDYFYLMPEEKFDRLDRERERAIARGWQPLTPLELLEVDKAVADCTNL